MLDRPLHEPRVFRRSIEAVVPVVYELQWSSCQFVRRNVVESGDRERVELAAHELCVSCRVDAHSACLAEAIGQARTRPAGWCPLVGAHVAFTGQQVKVLIVGECKPSPHLCADGTVAPNRSLGKIKICLISNGSAMAAASDVLQWHNYLLVAYRTKYPLRQFVRSNV